MNNTRQCNHVIYAYSISFSNFLNKFLKFISDFEGWIEFWNLTAFTYVWVTQLKKPEEKDFISGADFIENLSELFLVWSTKKIFQNISNVKRALGKKLQHF